MAAPAKAWETVDFTYERDGREFPGIIVRLPEGQAAPFYAACRICTHQGCAFGYETNYRQVGDIVGVDLENPVFFCRCHLSVYDPAHAGRVVSGPAPRPPWQFSVRAEGSDLVVTGLEAGAGDIKS
ncbi:MAG: ubiquinol-cytochrome c reductase iron-sulfur subunit [Gemmatimonas sp.]